MKLTGPLLTLLALVIGRATAAETGGTLLLKSGFENGVQLAPDMSRIIGSDVRGFTWETTPRWESSRFAYLVGRDL